MDKILHVASTFKSHEVEDGSVMIRGMASTDHSDRAGDVIAAEAWTKGGLENFKNNPVILFNHDYNKPIGRATGVNVTKNGLELEAKISKAAKDVCDLVKDGVLGAFSVGFKVKDADYVKETDGLMIKDAELFEVSVVSVPCNQAATFSLAKSFDSVEEYEAFKKTFTNRVDLTGQSLTSKDSIESNVVSDAPKQVEKSTVKETKMSEDTKTPEIDLEAFAKKVADETAAKIAMKQAETKAAEEAEAKAAAEAEAEKAAQQEQVKSTIRTGIETGAEKLMADVQADMEKASGEQIAEVTAKYEAELKAKAEELEQMRNSKRDFSGRKSGDLTAFGKDFLGAHILGKVTGKGMETSYAKDLMEKAGVTFTSTSAAGIDVVVSTTFEEEVRQEQKLAGLFREIQVASGATVLPIAPDTEAANFANPGVGVGENANILESSGNSSQEFATTQVILQAHRLFSGSFISNDDDEQVVVSLLPIITSALARAHAIAIDSAILKGENSARISDGIIGDDGADDGGGYGSNITVAIDNGNSGSGTNIDASVAAQKISPAGLLGLRSQMGKYGIRPSDVAYIVNNDEYYNLIDASGFTDITEVGTELATKLTGVVGSVFGSPVIVTDQIGARPSGAGTTTAAAAVYMPNYVIPRLRGVTIETDYEVANQRNVIVASQSLGFNQLVAASGSNRPAVRVPYS